MLAGLAKHQVREQSTNPASPGQAEDNKNKKPGDTGSAFQPVQGLLCEKTDSA